MQMSSSCLNNQKVDEVPMNAAEIIRYINDGANHYIALFGEAEHMERYDVGHYSVVSLELVAMQPKYRRRGHAQAVCCQGYP